jgi:FXSXX-COOH protein
MLSTEELRPAFPSAMADLRDVPLAEMPALNLAVLGTAFGRALPDPMTSPVRVAAFQSSL